MQRIPITFIDYDGKPTSDHIKGFPCVRIAVVEYGDGRFPSQIEVKPFWALIDSGADWAYVDTNILMEIGAVVRGAGNINEDHGPASLYRCFLAFPEFNFCIQAAVLGKRFPSEPYSAAIGRFALEHFDFIISQTEGGSFLQPRNIAK